MDCLFQKKILLKSKIKSPDFFQGMLYSENLNTNKLIKLINNIKNGTTEIMTHPKSINGLEVNALINPRAKKLIKDKKINLINYAQL